MDITFRTLGPWGSGKGANLQPSEVDANFWSIAEAILTLQNNPALPVGIASVSVSGTQMTITLSDGTVMGPFTLPVLTFRWRDEWQANTTYAVLDVFKVTNTGIFMVQIGHTSGSTFDATITDAGGNPILLQLFGSTDAALSGLSDVRIAGLSDGDVLVWSIGDQLWENRALGDMAFQQSGFVSITGGAITGLNPPANPTDAATKNYVDTVVTAGAPAIPAHTMLCNDTAFPNTAAAATLSDFLDAVLGTTVVGNLISRGGPGWAALAPGPTGYLLTSMGAGVGIGWVAAPGGGVANIATGAGLTGGPITSTGTISLAAIADAMFLANISGASAAPVPIAISAFLDHALTTARGSLLTRTIAGWVALAPGTSGLYLKTQGSGNDLMWDAPPGAGTVLSVATGTGLTGGPITSTGTIALAAIANLNLLANTSGGSAAPVPTTATLLLDSVFSSSRGAVLYRGATAWVALAPGTSGQFLATGGTTADPSWQNAPITGAATPNLRIVSNISGSSAVPTGNTLSAIFDAVLTSARGSIIYRTNSGWTALAPGTAGQVLTTNGGTADPTWNTNQGALFNIASPAAQDTLAYNTSSGRFENVRPRYLVSLFVPGIMGPSQSLLLHRFSKAVTFPANFGAYLGHTSQAASGSAATASTTIQIQKALSATPTTWTSVATIVIAAAGVLGTFSTQAAISFAQGDLLRIRGPATPDTTLADFTASIVGFES